jgi:hypothetical protein
LPDLFREKQGVVAEGTFENGVFIARTILAKHDEYYMPREYDAETTGRLEAQSGREAMIVELSHYALVLACLVGGTVFAFWGAGERRAPDGGGAVAALGVLAFIAAAFAGLIFI